MSDEYGIKRNIPAQSPILPKELRPDSTFQFDCHKGIACFNACCKNIDITLTPYDIIRLKNRLGLDSKEFVGRYTVPFAMDHHNLPGLKMVTKSNMTECIHLTEKGCGVYEDRPAACRYYALGSMAIRKKESTRVDNIYFVVKEEHCLGHSEPREQTVANYRREQGIEKYDEMNRGWYEIILKKRSSGPAVGAPSQRSLQMFDMCSYDMDSFAQFIQSSGFQSVFTVSEEETRMLLEDEEKLLQFSMRFLKQVLYGEMTIPVREKARERRMSERKEVWTARKEEAVRQWREQQEEDKYREG